MVRLPLIMMQNLLRQSMKYGYPTWQAAGIQKDMKRKIFKWHIVWALVAGLLIGYTSFLVMMDIGFLLAGILHLTVVLPLMKRGLMPGYFRADYSKMRKLYVFRDILVVGALYRFGGFFLVATAIQPLTSDFGTQGFFPVDVWGERFTNPFGLLVPLVLYAVYLYVMYFHERAVEIKSYFSDVTQRVYENQGTVASAAASTRAELIRKWKEPRNGRSVSSQESESVVPLPVAELSVQQIEREDGTEQPNYRPRLEPELVVMNASVEDGPQRRRSRREDI